MLRRDAVCQNSDNNNNFQINSRISFQRKSESERESCVYSWKIMSIYFPHVNNICFAVSFVVDDRFELLFPLSAHSQPSSLVKERKNEGNFSSVYILHAELFFCIIFFLLIDANIRLSPKKKIKRT
jgi:hypothetical protein